MNLIRPQFVESLPKRTSVNKIMFMLIPEFCFLDIINYLGPSTSYDNWVKAYGCTVEKSWFPYEWFDSPGKLDYPGLPDYPVWYSRLRKKFSLSL